jgi:hypothetical protein
MLCILHSRSRRSTSSFWAAISSTPTSRTSAALFFFREKLVQLEPAGIRVFLIHGNHDAQGAISRHLELPGNVTTFASRVAQTATVPELGVAVHGRSFPARAVEEDFARDYPPAVPGLYNIGLLHGVRSFSVQ